MTDEELVRAAAIVAAHAYAPYSGYAVGAALWAAGRVFTGVNVENASFGLTICAERTAAFAAVTGGVTRFERLALVTRDQATPCGACRQVLWEFAPDLAILVAAPDGRFRRVLLRDLLPEPFRVRKDP